MNRLSITILTFLCALVYPNLRASETIVEGTLDLRDDTWQTQNEPIALRGEWEFYWSKLLAPSDFETANDSDQAFIQVPGSWNQVANFDEKGFATYRLRVILSKRRSMSIHLPVIFSASKIYVDGRLMREIGKVGDRDDPDVYTPHTQEVFLNFTPKSKEFDIIIQVSSFEFFLAGIYSVPRLGLPDQIHAHSTKETAGSFFLVGSLFIMGIYHFCLFTLRRGDRSTLWFGLFCFNVGIYMAVSTASMMFILFGELKFNTFLRLYNFWTLANIIFPWYSYYLFPKRYPKWFAWGSTAFIAGIQIYIFTHDARDFVPITLLGQLNAVLVGVVSYYTSWRAIKAKDDGGWVYMTGFSIPLFASFHDMALASGYIISIPLMAGATYIFIFVQSYLLAKRFSNAFNRVETSAGEIQSLSQEIQSEHDQVQHLNHVLESRVEQQTRNIKSIMKHIRVGIFTISNTKFTIDSDYSAYLGSLFGEVELAGKTATALLFRQSNLTADQISQAESALEIALGEDRFLFDTNKHCLPIEIKRTRHDKLQILELSWNPVVNDEDIVQKILITVRDVTELRILETEAQDKREELEFIGELVNVTPGTFKRFINSCKQFLEENIKLLHSKSIELHDLESLKVLFINMHTMKGAARSLYFKKMTSIFHEVEQYYAELQKNPNASWDIAKMRRDIRDVEDIIEVYESIAKKKLGRNLDSEDEHAIPYSKLNELFNKINTVTEKISGAMKTHCKTAIQNIDTMVFPKLYKSCKLVLSELCASLPRLAKDLDKEAPRVQINVPELYMNRQGEELLRKVFVHLLRNSMDHGIETSQQRSASGKEASGQISISLHRETPETYRLIYFDDGRGLMLEKIRKKAVSIGLIDEMVEQTPKALAELIFHSGFSTASQVNDISGRGVGMDAINRYIKDQGGYISIKFREDIEEITDQGVAFLFEIDLPSHIFVGKREELRLAS